MTKKIISLLLAVVVCVGLCTVIASAAGTTREVATEAELATALTNAEDGDTISLKNDIIWTSTGKALINDDVTIEGNGKTLTFTNSKFGLRVENTAVTEVAFQNLTIVNTVKDGRCINIYADGVDFVTIDNCVLDASNATGAPQPLTLGGTEAGGTTVVYVTDSEIKTSDSGYGIISFLTVDLYVEGCTFTGWNALYLKPDSDGSYVQVSDSVIDTVNVHSGLTNAFAAIQIESNKNLVDIYNTKITGTSEGDQPQAALSLGSGVATDVTGNEITIQPDCEVDTDSMLLISETDNVAQNDVYVPAEYAEDLVDIGYVVVLVGGYASPAVTQEAFDDMVATKTNHKLNKVESDVPACAENGHKTYYVCECDICSEVAFLNEEGTIAVELSAIGPEPHTLKKVEEVKATEEKEGCKEHYICEVCEDLFSDAEGTKAVTKEELVIKALGTKDNKEETKKEEVKNPPTGDISVVAVVAVMVLSSVVAVVTAREKNRV